MNSFEIIWAVIWAIFVLVTVAIPLFLLITGLIKNEVDKGEKGNTGIIGWIIAILIASTIFYALFRTGGDFSHFRHT